MATETAHLLPAIGSLRVSHVARESPGINHENESKEKNAGSKASSYLASFGLGCVQKQPRPGDVYKRPYTSSAGLPRPLGLIPNRGTRLEALREFTKMLSLPPASAPVGSIRGGEKDTESAQNNEDRKDPQDNQKLISAAVYLSKKNAEDEKTSEDAKSSSKQDADRVDPTVPFRLSAAQPETERPVEAPHISLPVSMDDHEYVDTLAKCNIKEYGISDPVTAYHHRRVKTLPTTYLQENISCRLPSVQTSPGSSNKSGRLERYHQLLMQELTFSCVRISP